MAVPAEAPADTAMMGIVHSALRRDLTRTSEAVSGSPPPGDDQRRAIAEHVAWMMDFLHRHHAGEDDGLWPLVRQRDPTAERAPRRHGRRPRPDRAADRIGHCGREALRLGPIPQAENRCSRHSCRCGRYSILICTGRRPRRCQSSRGP